jgi:hypothetical protein
VIDTGESVVNDQMIALVRRIAARRRKDQKNV